MERRTFLELSAYTALALTVPFLSNCSTSPDMTLAQPFFLSHLVDLNALVQAGKSYLKKYPAEKDISRLKSKLLSGSKLTPASEKYAIQKYLNNSVADDFKQNKTVLANGWVLSVTEARQCALLALLKS